MDVEPERDHPQARVAHAARLRKPAAITTNGQRRRGRKQEESRISGNVSCSRIGTSRRSRRRGVKLFGETKQTDEVLRRIDESETKCALVAQIRSGGETAIKNTLRLIIGPMRMPRGGKVATIMYSATSAETLFT